MHQYAWLELEGDEWHFLTCLSANPEKSNRRWTDPRCALKELSKEGWAVVRPYPRISKMENGGMVQGYGLCRDLPTMLESCSAFPALGNKLPSAERAV
jgi:hypothetical protein